jgi:hypothetical protein
MVEKTIHDYRVIYGLYVLTIKVQCPKCGHVWGVKLSEQTEIPKHKFICLYCLGKD